MLSRFKIQDSLLLYIFLQAYTYKATLWYHESNFLEKKHTTQGSVLQKQWANNTEYRVVGDVQWLKRRFGEFAPESRAFF